MPRSVKERKAKPLPDLIETDERNKWLYTCSKTFSTVFEAIEFLESLRAK